MDRVAVGEVVVSVVAALEAVAVAALVEGLAEAVTLVAEVREAVGNIDESN